MPSYDIMRYYQSFPTVIPLIWADCSRVTHPSATKHTFQLDESSIQIVPFDLHVLSTPPAFILSQDQTLNKMVSIQPLSCTNLSYRSLPVLQRIVETLHFAASRQLLEGLSPSGAFLPLVV